MFAFLFKYKLFLIKLQKSLNHTNVELSRFQENNMYRDNSSLLGLVFSSQISKISDYTLSEWEEIQTNLKSSLIFMEQIIVRIVYVIFFVDNKKLRILCFRM